MPGTSLARSGHPRLQLAGAKTWMPGTSPLLSGSDWAPWEQHLRWVEDRWRFGGEESVEGPAMHQVGADEAGEGERAGDGVLRGLGHAQQQKGDQGDGDLDLHGIFAGPKE